MKHRLPTFAMVFSAVLAAPTGPAIAQQSGFQSDFGLIEKCLQEEEGLGRMNCVGLAADDCQMRNEGGTSTVGMGFCLGAERDWWDARLNETYGNLIAKDKADDAEFADLSYVPKKAPALQAMQRAWIPYRDAVCEYEVVQWGGGTGAGPAWSTCTMVETARQYFVLVDRLKSEL